jgi:hypothetical protein
MRAVSERFGANLLAAREAAGLSGRAQLSLRPPPS